MIIITSNLLDELASSGDTRRLMMVVGRQLGHIAAGHFHWWFFKDFLGIFTGLVYTAYRRRCHYTADRIGFLVAGDLGEANAALLTITVGKTLTPQTNFDAIHEQHSELQDSFLARLRQWLDTYPFMISRLQALGEFNAKREAALIRDAKGRPIQIFRVNHQYFTGVSIGTQIIGDNARVATAG